MKGTLSSRLADGALILWRPNWSQACMEGLALALDRSILTIKVETDCAQLLIAVQAKENDRLQVVHLIT